MLQNSSLRVASDGLVLVCQYSSHTEERNTGHRIPNGTLEVLNRGGKSTTLLIIQSGIFVLPHSKSTFLGQLPLIFHLDPRFLFAELPSRQLSPSLYCLFGVIPTQMKNVACVFIYLQEVPVRSWLQCEQVPVKNSPALQQTAYSSQSGFVHRLAEKELHSMHQSLNPRAGDCGI